MFLLLKMRSKGCSLLSTNERSLSAQWWTFCLSVIECLISAEWYCRVLTFPLQFHNWVKRPIITKPTATSAEKPATPASWAQRRQSDATLSQVRKENAQKVILGSSSLAMSQTEKCVWREGGPATKIYRLLCTLAFWIMRHLFVNDKTTI